MKCPGQDTRYWRPGAIFEAPCPRCGNEVEFFRDDTARKCARCGYKFVNPRMDFGCAVYCPHADQCLGDLPPALLGQKEDLLKDRVAVEMKRYFGRDFRRIGHAANVARYAEQIVKDEGGNPAVILCAAYLHDIGIHEAERKYHSTAAKYQHAEGPPIARAIMTGLGAREDLVEEVCDIIGHHHHPRDEETLNFKVVHDADFIANLEEKQKEKKTKRDTLAGMIDTTMFTAAGKQLAQKALLD